MEPGSEGSRLRRLARVGGRVVVALLSATVLATTGYGWSVYQSLNSRITTTTALPAPPEIPRPTSAPGIDAPFTALIVGVDSRTDAAGEPLPAEMLAQMHAGVDEGERNTDTIILLHLPAGPDARVVAISFPRDSYVRIAGDHGTHKINSAYARGMNDPDQTISGVGRTAAEQDRSRRDAGRRALVATVQELAGIHIDHFAEINLAGFVEITDALDGVPVCLNSAVREPLSGINLPAGQQIIHGADALAFVRQRHGLDNGDLGRINRQQAFLAGLTSSALSTGALADPRRVDRLVRAVSRYVVLDRGWDLRLLLGQLRRISGGDITFQTIPTGRAALQTPSDGVALAVDPDEVRQFVGALVDSRLDGQPPHTAATPSPTSRSDTPAPPTPTPTPSPGAGAGAGAGAIGSPATTAPSIPPSAIPLSATPSATQLSATPSARPAAAPRSTTARTRGTARSSSAGRPTSSTSATSSAPTSATTTTSATPPPLTAGGVPCVD